MRKFTIQDCQQGSPDGSRIVSIHPGAFVVRVHEARDWPFCDSSNRYYISVDLRFRESDALRRDYWIGYAKSEATKLANGLSHKLTVLRDAIDATEAGTLRGKEILLARHNAAMRLILGRYSAEIVESRLNL